jgi:hypothetical protein
MGGRREGRSTSKGNTLGKELVVLRQLRPRLKARVVTVRALIGGRGMGNEGSVEGKKGRVMKMRVHSQISGPSSPPGRLHMATNWIAVGTTNKMTIKVVMERV